MKRHDKKEKKREIREMKKEIIDIRQFKTNIQTVKGKVKNQTITRTRFWPGLFVCERDINTQADRSGKQHKWGGGGGGKQQTFF